MKIVIDIPEKYYKGCKDFEAIGVATLEQAIIAHGTPYEERPSGEWIFSGVCRDENNPIDSDSYYCSICKRSISTTLTKPEELFPFCHCGADMRKKGGEQE